VVANLAAITWQAHVSNRALQRQVERLLHVVGDVPSLPLDEQSVVALHIKTEDALEEPELFRIASDWQKTLDWGRAFYAMGEEYFEAVAKHTKTEEPWRPYLLLGQGICTAVPEHQDPELKEARRYFDIGRRFMRQAAYFYVRNTYGSRTAGQIFPDARDDIIEKVIQMAFPD